MEEARAAVMEAPARPAAWRMRAIALRELLPHPRRIGALVGAMRVYQRSPLRALVTRSGVLDHIAPPLAAAERSMPLVPRAPFRPPRQPDGLTRSVALLTGCVMPHIYPRTHDATVRVLNRLGYRVIFPKAQTCCGALSLHAGDRTFARDLARRNVAAFLADQVDAIVVNSAGCGSTMKEYGELLAADPEWSGAAARAAALTHDVLEFVAGHDLRPLGAVEGTVTYQDSCHLVHAQKVASAPREILRRIPGLELREMRAPDRCCGSAGVYSFVQPDMARRLLVRKMDDVESTGAATIATANPGCMMQLEAGVRQRAGHVGVVHVIELLDEAMRAGGKASE